MLLSPTAWPMVLFTYGGLIHRLFPQTTFFYHFTSKCQTIHRAHFHQGIAWIKLQDLVTDTIYNATFNPTAAEQYGPELCPLVPAHPLLNTHFEIVHRDLLHTMRTKHASFDITSRVPHAVDVFNYACMGTPKPPHGQIPDRVRYC